MLINLGELGENVAIGNCCHGQVVQGLCDFDGRVGAVKVVLRRIHLVVLLAILIFGGEELIEMNPGFINLWFSTPHLAGFIIVSCGTYGIICRLYDLFCCESNITIGGILNSVINALEVKVYQLRGVNGLVHKFLHSSKSAGVIFT